MGYESTISPPDLFTDPRTGLVFASQSIAESLGYNRPVEYVKSKVTGEMVVDNGQMGSQWWMNTNYNGPEPSLEVKLATTGGGSADYARDWIGSYAGALAAAGVDLSGAVRSIATDYPAPSISTQQVWNTYPAISPAAAAAINYPDAAKTGTVTAATPSASPGSTAEPSYIANAAPVDTSGPKTTGGGTTTTTTTTTSAAANGIGDLFSKYGLIALGGLLFILLIASAMLGMGSRGTPA